MGRVFSVTRQTWRLSDDPKTVRPELEVIAARRTASEAADLAREAAAAFERHGFHKPSGAWWGADAERFHRFIVRPGSKPAQTAAVIGLSLAGVAAVALARRRAARRSKG